MLNEINEEGVGQREVLRSRIEQISTRIHRPLRRARWDLGRYNHRAWGDFRLLELEDGLGEAKIECRLSNHTFATAPPFEALSYTWGSPTDGEAFSESPTISCNEHEWIVTPNLHAALRQLRRREVHRMLWVDAICINQIDEDEKYWQMYVMGNIYQQASMVLVWLGEECFTDPSAFDSLQRLYDFFLEMRGRDIGNDEILALAKCTQPGTTVREVDPDNSSILDLLRRRWFRRLWVLQEVVMAQRCTILCGRLSLPWNTLDVVMDELGSRDLWDVLFSNTSHIAAAQKMLTCVRRLNVGDKDTFSLLELLDLSQGFEATFYSDKVYALVGMLRTLRNQINIPIQADASFGIFYTLGLQCLKLYSLQVLSYALFDSSEESLHVPSWIPRWDRERLAKPFATMSQRFEPLGGPKGKFNHVKSDRSLRAQGAVFDQVSSILSLIHPIQDSTFHYTFLDAGKGDHKTVGPSHNGSHSFLDCCENFVKIEKPTRPFSQDPNEILWRTIICNTDAMGYRASDEMSNAFEACKSALRIPKAARTISTSLDKSHDPQHDLRNTPAPEHASRPYIAAMQWTTGRALYRTVNGYLGMVPVGTMVGDRVCALRGALSPMVIRAKEGDSYQLVGECYIHGLKDSDIAHHPRFWKKQGVVKLV